MGAIPENEVLEAADELVPSKADALEWYKWGRPYRTYRPKTMRYRSGRKVYNLINR